MQNAFALPLLAALLALLVGAPQERSLATAAAPSAQERTAAYDVRDLCARRALLTADPEEATQARREALSDLVEILRENLSPPALEGKLAALGEGTLVVLATDEIHALVEAFLADLRRYSGTLVDLQFELVTLSAAQAAELGLGEQTQLFSGETGSIHEVLTALAARDASVERLRAPRVLAYSAQRAKIDTLERVPYVAGYRAYDAVEPTGRPLVDPLVAFVEEGAAIECRPTLHHDQEHVTVELSAEFKRAQRPFEARATEHGPVCAPTVATRRFESTVVVPVSATTVAFPAATVDGRATVLLMRVARVDAEPK